MASSGFSSPATGPSVNEWSMGMHSILPPSVILPSLTCFPKTKVSLAYVPRYPSLSMSSAVSIAVPAAPRMVL